MGSFHRVDTSKLVRGAGRLMYAASTVSKPASISDVVELGSGASQYDAQTGWYELGATTSGIQISINNAEDGFEIDQIAGQVATAPSSWECFVTTRLAEMSLEHMVFAWEGASISTDTTVTPYERETGFAGASSYTERRLTVLFKKPSDLIWAFMFHRAVRSPQEGVVDMQKSGAAMSIAVKFKILADASETDPLMQFFRVREQI